MGTRDLRIALILRASPLPAWINCRVQNNHQIQTQIPEQVREPDL